MLIIWFFLVSCVRTSTSIDRLGTGQSMRDGETLVSVDGSFELGFFSPKTCTSRYLGVWYRDASRNPTVVWVANRERPLQSTSGVLKFSDKGILQLLNDANTSVVWSSNISSSLQTSNNLTAQLLDSGNLVVKYQQAMLSQQDAAEDNFLWQSFDYPSDTLMPGMKLGLNLVTGLNRFLSCWKSSNDLAIGEYSLKIKPKGYPQLVQMKGSVIVTRAGPWNGLSFSGYPYANNIYSIDFVVNDEEIYYQVTMSDRSLFSIYRTITSGTGNVLVWTSQTRNQVKNTPTQLVDQCEMYAFCGSNSICYMDGNAPTCECLKAYVSKFPKQWNMSDWSSGCIRKTSLDCNNTDGFLRYRDMKLPDTSSSTYNKTMNLEECRESCLKNCSCAAYANMDIRNGGSGCLLWFDHLIDMRMFSKGGQDLYIKVPASELVEMSATVTGLENLMKAFFEVSDDENAEEKDVGKSEGPSGEKEGQDSPVRETETSGKQAAGGQASPVHEEGGADGHVTLTPHPDSDVELIHTPKKRKMSSIPEGALTVMERNFDASKFIDFQLIPGTEEHFHATELSGQARWMYRTLLRGAVIARKAEFELSGMEALRRKLESSVKANNDFKAQVELLQGQLSEMGGKLNAAEEKSSFVAERLKASDETVARLLEREMTLEGQLNAAQGRVVALEKEREQAVSEAKAAKAEAVELKKKLKVAKKQGKNAILMTEDALKAQLKIAAPDFETSSIGVFKTIQDGKIVDMPRK